MRQRKQARLRWLFCALLMASGCAVEAENGSSAGPEASAAAQAPTPDHLWPPRVGETYPNLQLRNTRGERVSLGSFRGRVILIEPIGMDCPACNAFAGGNRPGVGGFQGVRPQGGLPAVEEILRDYAGGTSLSDKRIVLIHLLLYKPGRNGAPSLATARLWAEHFGIEDGGDTVVLVGEDYLIGPASFEMIPGFQLIDRDLVLRFDSSGHHPRHDLWRELMPAVPALLANVGPSSSTGG